jgi:Cd2+/Zn2+-exporting ATPase
VAAAVELRSQHPLAQAVVRRAMSARLILPEAGDLVSITAKGVRSSVAGRPVVIGSLKLWLRGDDQPPRAVREVTADIAARGRSVMVVRHGEQWLGVLGLADQPRPTAAPVLERLRSMGLGPMVMLTGDHQAVGEIIGREVGVDQVLADLLPEQKVDAIRELMREHGPMAMVGDGINDAPALASATVGIAMGGAGTAAALETADAALMGDDLMRLPFAIGLAQRTRALLRQNLAIAGGMMVILLILAAAGVLSIGPAVIGHEGSTLVVIANALRLLGYEEK